ncbi:MAG: DEAD/DEAH box helicase, partial [Actinomycetota bacterium]
MLEQFHPLTRDWFVGTFGEPTPPQTQGWARIAEGDHTLIAAPTGSGKTLAAFMWAIDELVRAALEGTLGDRTHVVYVSPLKALGNDIHKNLQIPLAGIHKLARARGLDMPEIRVAVRSGDTPQSERAAMVKQPPHILVTTPESLFILLTAERSRAFLQSARTVIVDEIHAVAGDKRGAHLALSLERLDRLCDERLQRIGLSATQKPIEEIGSLLTGAGGSASIVDAGHQRDWDLSVWVPEQPLGPIATHELRAEVLQKIVSLVAGHRTTLVFVNTRRLAERIAHELTEILGEGKVAAHHGSLSRAIRLKAEAGLKSGEIPVVVATASLELGIDIGHVDLVCHLGAPRALATMLQRIGRSGHRLGGAPKGVLFPMTRDDLVQSAAAVYAARAGRLDRINIPAWPRDVLAQQIVAIAASEDIGEDELWSLVTRAMPYRDLPRAEFDEIVEVLSEGIAGRYGRRSAHLHRDRVNHVVRGRRGARLAAITSGGAIPDVADYDVIEDPQGTFVGKVNEDFAIESMAGDVFLLGNMSWRIRRVESGKVRVEDAHGSPPTIPFWVAEAPARTAELSEAVSELRALIQKRLGDRPGVIGWLVSSCGIDEAGAEQIVAYVEETLAMLGAVPTQDTIVAERFFDESGGMQLILHAPFGARINRAWGLALRKRFCVTFDFELQAAATDDGIILSLGEQHSFPLESVFNYVRTPVLDDSVTQAVLQSPVFGTRWRWNASRALALLRHAGGRRVPMPIQRMRAEDLLSAVFPDQVACQDNNVGPITPPDHPLVNETMRDCLQEWMDLEGLRALLHRIEAGEIRCLAAETPAPSPMSHEILNSNPYAFLDDAPLEERRARAVSLRRVDPDLARGIGALDTAAIEDVRAQAAPDIRDEHELHDVLLSLGVMPVADAEPEHARALIDSRRATVTDGSLIAAERVALARHALRVEIPFEHVGEDRWGSEEAAVKDIVLGWVQITGPITAAALATRLRLREKAVDLAFLTLENTGMVLRGSFTAGAEGIEWCDRRLLARIHRLTLGRLRAEIEAVSQADFMRFLFRWQHVQPGTQLHGRDGIAEAVEQLSGIELPAPAWEEHVFPARVRRYNPADLETLCLSGAVTWGKLSANGSAEEEGAPAKRRAVPARNTPIAFVIRDELPALLRAHPDGGLSAAAAEVYELLRARGASFQGELARATGRMQSEVEDSLWELVARGLVSGDGVAGLRMLLRGGMRRTDQRLRALHGGRARARALPVGRWALWGTDAEPMDAHERVEA